MASDDIKELLGDHPGLGRIWDVEAIEKDPETWISLHEAVCNLALSGDFPDLPASLYDRLVTINRMVSAIALISGLPMEKDL